MSPILATSYDGLYEGIMGWHAAILVGVGISIVLARTQRRWRIAIGIIVASLCCLLVVPTAILLTTIPSGGSMSREWAGLILLSLASCGAAFFSLVHGFRKWRAIKPTAPPS